MTAGALQASVEPRGGEQEARSDPPDSHMQWAGGTEAVRNGRTGTKPREQRVMSSVQCYDNVKEDESGNVGRAMTRNSEKECGLGCGGKSNWRVPRSVSSAFHLLIPSPQENLKQVAHTCHHHLNNIRGGLPGHFPNERL